ncbi:hypothetical protein QAD02_000344 [Eretmocerus hayati]|uniref:Uncharacterized protein n=1 Tax=Eretmocerus hayati TaxID=131215 RepID=A0ACC2ND55_9HYME|nr:hypothetical protein QAD02_000344 [Eretmocerus hayati]
MSQNAEGRGNKNVLSILSKIQELENEAEQFQKEVNENKRNYSSPTDVIDFVIRGHPLIKHGLDIWGESGTMKIGCLIKFYVSLQNFIDEARKESVNYTCKDLDEFQEILDSMLKDLVDSRTLVVKELENEANTSKICEGDLTNCLEAREFIDKAEIGYVVIFGLRDGLPKLKEKCLLQNLESEIAVTKIRKKLLEPIIQCSYPHKRELIPELPSNHIDT